MDETRLLGAQEYLDNLYMFQWCNISQVPLLLQNDVYSLLDTNLSEAYSITWHETECYLFMKVQAGHKKYILDKLKELESNIGKILWVYVNVDWNDYVIMLGEDGRIINDANKRVNTIFKPTTHIIEYFDWLYKHAKKLELKYRNDTNRTKSEETGDTG